jgi:hypothetical protein
MTINTQFFFGKTLKAEPERNSNSILSQKIAEVSTMKFVYNKMFLKKCLMFFLAKYGERGSAAIGERKKSNFLNGGRLRFKRKKLDVFRRCARIFRAAKRRPIMTERIVDVCLTRFKTVNGYCLINWYENRNLSPLTA